MSVGSGESNNLGVLIFVRKAPAFRTGNKRKFDIDNHAAEFKKKENARFVGSKVGQAVLLELRAASAE